ncbi:MAG: SUMF1/EgtB/PvdO family nonheme iron enzyme [Planctomycetota bacterium]
MLDVTNSTSPAIFISYRHDDEPYAALLIYRELEIAFGSEHVFLDVRMRHGDHFPMQIEKALDSCRVLIAVIGPGWLRARDDNFRRRLDDPKDWVRLEIRHALQNGKRIIPLLVRESKVPSAAALPPEIADLAIRSAKPFRVDGWRAEDRHALLSDVSEVIGLPILEERSLPFTDLESRYLDSVAHRHVWPLRVLGGSAVVNVHVEQVRDVESSPGRLFPALAQSDLRVLLGMAARSDQSRRWLLLGEPGSGKSTAVKMLASDMAFGEQVTLIPVSISLSEWRIGLQPTWTAIASLCTRGDLNNGEIAKWLAIQAEKMRLRVFLDGLDEIPAQDQVSLINWLNSVPSMDGNLVMITSRPLGIRDSVRDWAQVKAHILPLDARQQEDLLRTLVGGESSQLLMTQLCKSPLKRFASNPLLLSIVGRLLSRDEDLVLPDTAYKMYDLIVQEILKSGWGNRNEPDDCGVTEYILAEEVLAELVLSLYQASQSASGWEEREVASRLRQVPQDLRDRQSRTGDLNGEVNFLRVVGRTRLFGELDGDRRGYRFLHRSLGESLASRALLRLAKSDGRSSIIALAQSARGLEGHWAEIFAMFVARSDDASEWLREIRGVNAKLARRALAHLGRIDSMIDMETLLDILSPHEDDEFSRRPLYLQLPDLMIDDHETAVKLLSLLASKVISLKDLWCIATALEEIARRARQNGQIELLETVQVALREELFANFPVSPGRSVMKWVRVPPSMQPGNDENGKTQAARDTEGPEIDVVPGKAFLMASTVVTNAMWKRFRPTHDAEAAPGGPNAPVVNVSWFDAAMFCRWIGARIPTLHEWRYACLAGSPGPFWFGSDCDDMRKYGWTFENSDGRIHEVGELPANPWGLFDMNGNVWELCGEVSEEHDGEMFRCDIVGGSYVDTASWSSADQPDITYADYAFDQTGFRPVIDIE